ncbi:transposase [Paenibacillus larvae]|nr:transposase [Paenibacillus larvae]MDT2237441.1 transposase [Paenibacillus larvae]
MRRTKYSNEFKKVQVVKEALEAKQTTVARRYELASNMLHRWVKEWQLRKMR